MPCYVLQKIAMIVTCAPLLSVLYHPFAIPVSL